MRGPFNNVREITKLLKEGQLTPDEVVSESAGRIREYDGICNSFISLTPEFVELADKAGKKVNSSGFPRPLSVVPFAVKDLIFTEGLPTTCGSKAPIPEKLKNRKQGAAIARLLEAGAVLAGKNNLHEFAFGITNENDHFGPVLNPWDVTRVSGGSSGGSAAAVAAGMVPFAIGTDTRGSIRIPSACCGVTGLKPTYNRIPVSGVVPLSESLDHIGPITRDVRDSELVFRIMCGELPPPAVEVRAGEQGAGDLCLGITDYYFTHVNREVSKAVYSALDFFRGRGIAVKEIRMSWLEDALEASDIISRFEAFSFHSANLAEFPSGYGPAVYDRISSGGDLAMSDLEEARKIKEKATEEFERVFSGVNCLLAPALPVTAVPLGTSELEIEGWKEPIVHGFVRFNAPQNMAGVPCLTVPCGFDSGGLPIGLQLISARNREDVLFSLGKLYQSETDWHLRKPDIARISHING
ncbi:MAG: amidase [Acidobacteriota bacterium]